MKRTRWAFLFRMIMGLALRNRAACSGMFRVLYMTVMPGKAVQAVSLPWLAPSGRVTMAHPSEKEDRKFVLRKKRVSIITSLLFA